MAFYERTALWNEQKQKKLAEVRKVDEDKDLYDCTFQPNVDKPSLHVTGVEASSAFDNKGVEGFLKRQVAARQQKEEKELKLYGKIGSMASPQKKSGANITIPRGPSLGGINVLSRELRSEA